MTVNLLQKGCVIAQVFVPGKIAKGRLRVVLKDKKNFIWWKIEKKKRCFIELRSAYHASGVLGDWFLNRCETDLLIDIVASRGRHYFPTFQMSKLRLREAPLTQPACGRDWSSRQVCHTDGCFCTDSAGVMTPYACCFLAIATQEGLHDLINE